jgi:type I restriction enzyme S subunit
VSWKHEQLVEICEMFSDGDWIESKDQSEDGIRLIQTGNVGLGLFKSRDAKARYINEETYKRLRCTEIKEGDILVSRLPDPVGRSCIIPILDKKSITAVDCTIIRVKKTVANSNYLNYYFQSPEYFRQVNKSVTGATRQRISRSSLGKIKIPLPSLATQQKIVAKLDAIFAEIDKAVLATEANVKNAESLFKCYLFEVFEQGGSEWNDKKLTDVAIHMGRGKSKHRPRNDVSLYGGEYPFIQTGDVRNSDKFITTYTQTYNEKGLAQSKLWKASTVCITIAANIAEIGILGFDACFPDSVIGIVVDKEKVSEDFLYLMLIFAQQRIKDKSKGSAQENINLGTFEDMLFKVAPLKQQEIIVQRFNNLKISTDFIRESNFKKLNELSNLKNSILKQAFNGELVKD